jgi:hypothetical protein
MSNFWNISKRTAGSVNVNIRVGTLLSPKFFELVATGRVLENLSHNNIGVIGFELNRFLRFHQIAQIFVQRIGIVLIKAETTRNF